MVQMKFCFLIYILCDALLPEKYERHVTSQHTINTNILVFEHTKKDSWKFLNSGIPLSFPVSSQNKSKDKKVLSSE